MQNWKGLGEGEGDLVEIVIGLLFHRKHFLQGVKDSTIIVKTSSAESATLGDTS